MTLTTSIVVLSPLSSVTYVCAPPLSEGNPVALATDKDVTELLIPEERLVLNLFEKVTPMLTNPLGDCNHPRDRHTVISAFIDCCINSTTK